MSSNANDKSLGCKLATPFSAGTDWVFATSHGTPTAIETSLDAA